MIWLAVVLYHKEGHTKEESLVRISVDETSDWRVILFIERIQCQCLMVLQAPRGEGNELQTGRVVKWAAPIYNGANVRCEPDRHGCFLETFFDILDEVLPRSDVLKPRIH